jgi:hypothetical protein
MPHVEVLPNSASSVAPGWTYVVDTGYDPSKVAINPKNKKRVAAQPGGPRGEHELSSRQQAAIARRIAELNRDNDPKQSIPIPGKTCMSDNSSVARRANHNMQQLQEHRMRGELYNTRDKSSIGLTTKRPSSHNSSRLRSHDLPQQLRE